MQTPWGERPADPSLSMAEQYDFLRGRVSRRGLLKGAALLTAGPLLLRSQRADAATPLGPRWVGFGNDPRTTMTVSSAFPGPFGSAYVEYGLDASFGSVMPLNVQGVPGVTTTYGAAPLTGLAPGTAYTYRVNVDGQVTANATFRTAPAAAGPFTFTAFGDEGTTVAAATIVARVAKAQPQVHLVAGDLCYADGSGQGLASDLMKLPQWDKWLRLIEPAAAQVPWMTTVGNHEMEAGFGLQGYDGYLARFARPDTGAVGCPATYHFRYGSVAFIQVDSNDVSYEIPHNLGYSAGAQDAWLASVLSGYRAPGSGVDFIVVAMHHCAYNTSRGHGSEGGVRDRWVALFDQYGVDLVISGHNHSYERTHLMRGGKKVVSAPRGGTMRSDKGTTYLTLGGGGAGLNTAGYYSGSCVVSTAATPTTHKKISQAANWSAARAAKYSYLVCKVKPSTPSSNGLLKLWIYDKSVALIDNIALSRPGPPPAPPVEPPTTFLAGARR